MSPCDLKEELQKRCLLNPVITEAIDLARKGINENYAFCWAALKLVDENEALKNALAESRRSVKTQKGVIDDQKFLIDEYKGVIDFLKVKKMGS
jgi:hypothetical protein